MWCSLSQKNCVMCEEIAQKWEIKTLIKSLEYVKGKLENLHLLSEENKLINGISKPLTEQEKCSLNLLLSGKSLKEIAKYLNINYDYLRRLLSDNLYCYCKILAEDLGYKFPNNQFRFSLFVQFLQQHNYFLSSSPPPSSSVLTIFTYEGTLIDNGKVKPKFTVKFQCELNSVNEDVIEQIVTTTNLITQDDRWVIVTDKKIIKQTFSQRKTRNYEQALNLLFIVHCLSENRLYCRSSLSTRTKFPNIDRLHPINSIRSDRQAKKERIQSNSAPSTSRFW